MASSSAVPPSPTTPRISREDSVMLPDHQPPTPNTRMLKIDSLLNPAASSSCRPVGTTESPSPPATPASTAHLSSTSYTPRAGTPNTTSSVKRQKLTKGTAALTRSIPEDEINYPPFESTDEATCLLPTERQELAHRHKVFAVQPAGSKEGGLIGNKSRYIPYSSEKRSFQTKTGKDGFRVFEYTFRVPDDPAQSVYTVIWDYDNGLTRITPFFKACKHSKTTPAKALSSNQGLKELAHSITGGALAAQGYWIPYACARALCLTFCYNIRWALTPIFGPSFVKECLPPNHPGFGNFRIDAETVRCATLEAEGWKPSRMDNNAYQDIPRSVPQDSKELRPRVVRPTFKLSSPFDSDGEGNPESNYSSRATPAISSPEISPKTSASYAIASPTWTSINNSRSTASPANTTVLTPLAKSLLTQPRYASWRPADTSEIDESQPRSIKMPTSTKDEHRVPDPPRSSSKNANPDAEYEDDDSSSCAGTSSSESDDADIIVSPPVNKKTAHEGVAKQGHSDGNTSVASTQSSQRPRNPKSKKFTTTDYRAAVQLLLLNRDDSHLGIGPGEVRAELGRKRKAGDA